jgi:uncharacterized protein (DUF433 family)
MSAVDPERGRGNPFTRNPRIAVQEVVAHALFGAVLGALVSR